MEIDFRQPGVYCGAYETVQELECAWVGYRGCFAIVGGEPYWHDGAEWSACLGETAAAQIRALTVKISDIADQVAALKRALPPAVTKPKATKFQWVASKSGFFAADAEWSDIELSANAETPFVFRRQSTDGGETWSEPVLSSVAKGLNGEDGKPGEPGPKGEPGKDGKDGRTPSMLEIVSSEVFKAALDAQADNIKGAFMKAGCQLVDNPDGTSTLFLDPDKTMMTDGKSTDNKPVGQPIKTYFTNVCPIV